MEKAKSMFSQCSPKERANKVKNINNTNKKKSGK